MTERETLKNLICNVICRGFDRTDGGCPERTQNKCRSIEKLELCQINKIADHLLANGVIVPPCKVGDTVYRESWFNDRIYEECKVSMITQKVDKTWKIRISAHGGVADYSEDEIGKTVFLTREEAVAALAERSKG